MSEKPGVLAHIAQPPMPARDARRLPGTLSKHVWPIVVMGVIILALWYGFSIRGNWLQAQQSLPPHAGFWDIAGATMTQDAPWIPPRTRYS